MKVINMSDEERKKLMENCVNGLKRLDDVLGTLLSDNKLYQDETLINSKKEIENQIDILTTSIEKSDTLKK